MVTVPAQNIYAFLVQEGHQHTVLFVEVTPEGEFRLQDDVQRVGSGESGLRWAPAMKAHVIDAIVCTTLQISQPRGVVHRHMTCQRPDTGIVLAAKKDAVAVLIE